MIRYCIKYNALNCTWAFPTATKSVFPKRLAFADTPCQHPKEHAEFKTDQQNIFVGSSQLQNAAIQILCGRVVPEYETFCC